MGPGCSVGSLEYHGEKGLKAVKNRFYPPFKAPVPFVLFLIFWPHLTIRTRYTLINGSKVLPVEGTKMKKEYIKPFAWGMAVGSIILLIVIFSAGWVVTSGTAEATAKVMAADAVLARLAPIAVEQFMQDPNKEVRLKEMKEVDSWKRGDFVKEQGWATMPGEEKPDSTVAREVADRLMKAEL